MIRVLAWKLLLIANTVGSFLTVSYAQSQFRQADASPVGGLVGVEVLILWVAFEVALIAVVAVAYIYRRDQTQRRAAARRDADRMRVRRADARPRDRVDRPGSR